MNFQYPKQKIYANKQNNFVINQLIIKKFYFELYTH